MFCSIPSALPRNCGYFFMCVYTRRAHGEVVFAVKTSEEHVKQRRKCCLMAALFYWVFLLP